MISGAFRSSQTLAVGQARYARKPFYLSNGQKQRVRRRLQAVDNVISTLEESNIRFKELNEALAMKKEHELTPREKYYVFSRDPRSHMKPVTQVPHFTKSPHPRGFPPGY